jgi:3D (Asp-Asp-Asp) domain-containing protein
MGCPGAQRNPKPMFLNRSSERKFFATVVGAVFFAALYEVTVMDSRFAAQQPDNELTAAPTQGARLRFTATGYCRGTTTASGVKVRSGIAAADPDLLPVGSVVQIDKLLDRYNGVYTVMDTGPKVHGRHLDIYIWNCDEALELGRRDMVVTVLRMGWNPRNSSPRLVDRLFRQREAILPRPARMAGPWPKAPSSGPDRAYRRAPSCSPARFWSLNWS